MRAFLNGQSVDAPSISALDEGLLYGYGVYETLRVYSGVAFRQDEHVRRLRQSAEKIELPVPSEQVVHDAIRRTIESNTLKDAALRVVLTAGARSDWGRAEPSLLVLARPFTAVPTSFKAISVPFHRDVAQAKTLNCLTSVMARKRAQAAGCDEAIFRIGRSVLEGTTCNVFAVLGAELLTPKDGVLQGVTRNAVLSLASDVGLEASEGPLTYDRLLHADEVFLTGTLKQIVPLVELDGKKLKVGPKTAHFNAAYSELVQREIQSQK
ncbi:aminotransferase class IV [Candidatus Micrarchaeota archaeon]|nr:aminotransferase class IV [Candidatus Micrarchaeota archaeon]